MTSPNPDFVASLLSARRSGGIIRLDGATEPRDLAEGFAVQTAVAHNLGAKIAGWKVGFSPGGDAVAGPMYADGMRSDGARWPLPASAPLIIEVEIALRLARDLPPRVGSPYTREEILGFVEEAVAGIEVIKSRVGEAGEVPYPVFLADNIGNAGYVVGAATRSFAGLDLRTLHCRLQIDGEVVIDADGGHPQGDPVEPLRAWASAPRDGLGGLRAGQIVTTGSLTGVTRLHKAASIVAEIEGIGRVTMATTAG